MRHRARPSARRGRRARYAMAEAAIQPYRLGTSGTRLGCADRRSAAAVYRRGATRILL